MRLLGTTLAVAALALAGCDGDDSEERSEKRSDTTTAAATNTAPAKPAAPKADTLTAVQYRARVNRLCREDTRFAEDLGQPGTADQIERFLRRTVAYGKKREPLYAALAPPPDLRSAHEQARRLNKRGQAEVENVLGRIEEGGDPVEELTAALPALARSIDQNNRLARRMGTKDCVVKVPEPGAQQPQQTF